MEKNKENGIYRNWVHIEVRWNGNVGPILAEQGLQVCKCRSIIRQQEWCNS